MDNETNDRDSTVGEHGEITEEVDVENEGVGDVNNDDAETNDEEESRIHFVEDNDQDDDKVQDEGKLSTAIEIEEKYEIAFEGEQAGSRKSDENDGGEREHAEMDTHPEGSRSQTADMKSEMPSESEKYDDESHGQPPPSPSDPKSEIHEHNVNPSSGGTSPVVKEEGSVITENNIIINDGWSAHSKGDDTMSSTQDWNSQPSSARWDNIKHINLPPPFRRPPILGQHQWMYRPAARVLQTPFRISGYPPPPEPRPRIKHGLITANYAGPDKRRGADERRRIRTVYVENKYPVPYRTNPLNTIPMRASKWKRMGWTKPHKDDGHERKILEEQERLRSNRNKAQQLGYETLVGNLVYHDIPGSSDLNRSWKHFLDQDPMAWGFPYTKGSTERPRLPLPVPYLVHQLKENLWKYPKNKLIVHADD